MTTVSRINAEYLFLSRNSRKRDYLFVLHYLAMNSNLKEYLINPRFSTAVINSFFSLNDDKAFKNIVHSITQVPERKLEKFSKIYRVDPELLKQFDSHIEAVLSNIKIDKPQLELFSIVEERKEKSSITNSISQFQANAEKMENWLKNAESIKQNQYRELNKAIIKAE